MAPDLIGLNDENYETLSKIATALGINYQKGQTQTIEQIVDLDTSNWIMIPEEFEDRGHKTFVDPARLSYNSAVEEAGQSLDLKLKNTAKDSLEREFVGNINWKEAMKLNISLGKSTLPVNQAIEFLYLLDQGAKGNLSVYTKSGKQLDTKYLEQVRDDIIKVQSPCRAEWLDADFKVKDKELYLNSNHELKNGVLVPKYSKPLTKDTLMKDKQISLNSFYQTRTEQGLPSNKTKSGDFYYWASRKDNNSVVRFYADGGWAFLSACGDPPDRGGYRGVRAVERHK